MPQPQLTEIVQALSPEEQAIVREFIKRLKARSASTRDSPFVAAADEFIEEHSDLLRRLAQ